MSIICGVVAVGDDVVILLRSVYAVWDGGGGKLWGRGGFEGWFKLRFGKSAG